LQEVGIADNTTAGALIRHHATVSCAVAYAPTHLGTAARRKSSFLSYTRPSPGSGPPHAAPAGPAVTGSLHAALAEQQTRVQHCCGQPA
jgi:hypothetical protein